MDRQPNESELFDFLEGSLPPEKHAEIKAYLEKNPELRASVEAAQRGSEALAACKIGVSINLTPEIMQKIAPPTTPGSLWTKLVLAFAGLALVVVCLFFMANPDKKQQQQPSSVPEKPIQTPVQIPPRVIATIPDEKGPSAPVETAQNPTLVLAAGERRVVDFPRIGSITLNGPGRFVVTESMTSIIQGSAKFDILKQDKNRPFRVSTDDAVITVIGTIFEVEKAGANTRVSLQHGTLRIEHTGRVDILESGWTAIIEGAGFVISKISENELVQPATDSSKIVEPYLLPEKNVTGTPAMQIPIQNIEPAETRQEPAASSQSPLELLHEWSIQTPDKK